MAPRGAAPQAFAALRSARGGVRGIFPLEQSREECDMDPDDGPCGRAPAARALQATRPANATLAVHGARHML